MQYCAQFAARSAEQQAASCIMTTATGLRSALASFRHAFFSIGCFSFVLNLLALTSPIYMMQVYNRVIPTHSEATLLMLSGLAAALIGVMALLELARARILVRISTRLDRKANDRVLAAAFAASLQSSEAGSAQGLRDFDTVRQFVSGSGTLMFFDLPWSPVFIAVIYLFHPVLGLIATVGAVLLVLLAVANELATRRPLERANRLSAANIGFVGGSLRNADTLQAMGMLGNLMRHMAGTRNEMLALQAQASDRAGALQAASRAARQLLQIALLAVGAWLAIRGHVSAGEIIAASIIAGRGLAPFEMAIGSWKQVVGVRQAYGRLEAMLQQYPEPPLRTSLPRPHGHLSVENVTVVPPAGGAPILRGVSFQASPGQLVCMVGRSGAGKSTLARLLVGAWKAQAGTVRLDGADIRSFNRDEIGPHIGYLPQEIDLFDGTIAENIARFGPRDSAAVVAAAQRAGVHETILRLRQGYETPVGPGGIVLSGGQRQRVGLARAVYGNPALVVLDEPNANLDLEGEVALVKAIGSLKASGATVVLITHKADILALADNVLLLDQGAVSAYGPRDRVFAAVRGHQAPPPIAAAAVARSGEA